MNLSRIFFYLFLISWLGVRSAADEVTLANGDRITGSVVKLDSGKLAVVTEYAGTVEIDWTKVERLRTENEILVEAGALGRIPAEVVERAGDQLRISSAGGEPIQVPADGITTLRTVEGQRAYEAGLHPGLFDAWAGELTVGFALARGNSETTNLATGLTGARQSASDKLSYYGTSVYATDRANATVIANAIRGGVRYDKNFTPGWFGFGSADFEFNELQGLDLRAISGGGIGWHAIQREHTTLDVLAGIAWTREEYALDPRRDFVSSKLGEEFATGLWPGTQLRQTAYYYPDLRDTAQYRFAFDLGLSSRMNSWLSWQTAVSNRYISNPPLGSQRNDILVTTGLGVKLGGGNN